MMRSDSAAPAQFTASLISPRGRGAVATWQIHASPEEILQLPFKAVQGTPLTELPAGRILFGEWHAEEAVLTRKQHNQWELSIHGGRAAVERVRRDLAQLGCQIADWQQALYDQQPTLKAEYVIAIANSVTWTTTEFLLRHPTQEWIEELHRWKQLCDRDPSATEREQLVARCREWLSWSDFGRHLILPYRVALVGEPNVGKSSLLNRLAGYERAIVRDQPGTTRDLVAVETAFSGFPFSLTDTAGLRDTTDRLESEGISRTHRLLDDVDLTLHLVDQSAAPGSEEQNLSARFPGAILIAHKSDRPAHPRRKLSQQAVRVSALTGEGVDELVSRVVHQLIPRTPDRQTIFPVTDRQIELLQSLCDEGCSAQPASLSATLSRLLSKNDHPAPSKR